MFYKILHGFGAEDYIEITKDEVEKAYYCFLTKKDSVFSGGAVRGSLIQAIKPDFHRTMKWNRGYKLTEFDYAELSEKGIDRKMQNFLGEAHDKVKYLIETNQPELIGKPVELPKKVFSEETKKLSDKFKV